MTKNTSVFGIFSSQLDANEVVKRLREGGFRPTDISVLIPENEGNKDLGHEIASKAPEGISVGGLFGSVVGGIAGWAAGAGLMTAISLPDMSQLLAAGPLLACFAGVGAGGILGALAGGIVGLTMPEIETKRYLGRLRRGNVLVSVHCDNDDYEKRARALMKHAGAEKLTSASEARADFDNSDRPHARHALHQI